jgi:hypothetical protein
MIRPSSATIVAPAEGPNNSTEVKTKVSEIEMVAGTDGSFTVAEPLRRVRAARVNHCAVSILAARSYAANPMTQKPDAITKAT